MSGGMSGGTVYTQTTIYSPPEAFAADAPYQIAIVQLDQGGRVTARIRGDAVAIGDRLEFIETRERVHFFRKSA